MRRTTSAAYSALKMAGTGSGHHATLLPLVGTGPVLLLLEVVDKHEHLRVVVAGHVHLALAVSEAGLVGRTGTSRPTLCSMGEMIRVPFSHARAPIFPINPI